MNCVDLAQSSTSVIYLEGSIVFFDSVINQCDLPWRVYELCSLAQSSTTIDLPGGYMNWFFGSVFNQCDLPGGYMNCVLWLSHQPIHLPWRVYELVLWLSLQPV